jgi:hypothetical protein
MHLAIPNASRLTGFLDGTTFTYLDIFKNFLTTEDFSLILTIYRLLFDNSYNGPAAFVSADFTPAVTFVGLRGHFHEFILVGYWLTAGKVVRSADIFFGR